MNAKLMMRHLRRALEIWPPSRARLPEYWLPPAEETFSTERDLLVRALDRFVESLEEQPDRKAVHTILGPVTLRSWSRAHGVHFRHHFRQFRLVRRS